MIYLVLLSFFIHLNYVYSMEQNLVRVNDTYPWEANQSEEPVVKKLMSLITCQDINEYLNWTYKPLADNFKQDYAWSANMVPNLLSTNPTTYQKANENCQILLTTINNNKNQLYQKQIRADRHRDVYICLPLIALLFQLYLNSYEPFGSLCIMEISRHCTANANALEDISHAFSRHRQQLILIENEISTIVNKSKNPTQRQNFITKLIENNKKEKEFHTNLINRFEQKPLSDKKND